MSGKSDAATTTDDMKTAPLCLFYFSHPFGILSPNPPSVTMAPRDCLPWLPATFSDSSWKQTGVRLEIPTDDTDFDLSSPGLKPDYPRPTIPKKQRHKKHDSIENKRAWYNFYSDDDKTRSNRALPPLDRNIKGLKAMDVAQPWPGSVEKFKRRTRLPPLDVQPMQKSNVEIEAKLESTTPVVEPNRYGVKRRRNRKSARVRIRPVRSSRGVNKGRSVPNKSATRKLISYLLSASRGNRVSTAALPPLGEVLRTVRQAWGSPKSLLPQDFKQEEFERFEKSTMGMNPPLLPGASPGLLRRRYSLPETVMRKYKLAQHKSDSDESDAGSAPSPRIPSPARGGRGRDRGPRSSLLRRILGRDPAPTFGGSHSELRYWDSRSGSSSPRSPDRGCEACKRLSDKNLSASTKADVHSPPVYRSYASQILMSPKRQRLKCGPSPNPSPERCLSQSDNIRSDRRSISPSTHIATGSSPERSLKSASETSSKLGLSSLVTSSYPVTENISTSELTRSSASITSDDTSRSQSNPAMIRPKTGDSIKSSPSNKKRRQSYAESRNTLILESPTSQRTDLVESGLSSYTKNFTDMTDSSEKVSHFYSSIHETTTSEKTTTSESQTTITTSTRRDTSSSSDSAMSTHTEKSSDYSEDTKRNTTPIPSSGDGKSKNDNRPNLVGQADLSDTGIELDTDSNKNTESSNKEDSEDNSKEGSVTYSEECSTDPVTCIERTLSETIAVKPAPFECLEVVVSEMLSSSAFSNKTTDVAKTREDVNCNSVEGISRNSTRIDIDQYVSNILIDSLNTMTDQINEINSNVDDDLKLNILEKEIKVKLKSVSASPINLITNPIITTLITNIPDKELLETTVIEETTRSVAYTTESKLFSVENSVKIEAKNSDGGTLQGKSVSNQDEQYSAAGNMASNILVNTTDDTLANNNVDFINTNNNEILYDAITDTPLPYDINENEETKNAPYDDIRTKAVLRQLHKMFENNTRNSLECVDSNFNVCIDNQPQTYFCGTQTNEISHLEMSTDVDVFVDNSLNKMMNSIDINYNEAELCESIGNMVFDKLEKLNGNEDPKLVVPPITIKEASDDDKSMISNIGTGSLYQKPPQIPLVVPRYSAVPHSDSMEVNTSSEEELSCQSDCMSLVDSLDDPNSPRPPIGSGRPIKRVSKHDKKLVRGDIMSLLPENAASENKLAKERSEMFFIPIKESTDEAISENMVVAEHMPEKIKEKLFRRQQKREMRKEYHRRKKLKQLKREMERQKKAPTDKANDDSNKDPVTLGNQPSENSKSEDSNKSEKLNSSSSLDASKKDKKTPEKRSPVKSEKVRCEDKLKNIESFVIDKRGNYQMTNSKLKPERTKETLSRTKDAMKVEEANMYVKNHGSNAIESVEKVKILKTKRDLDKTKTYDSGPRRLYQKTEFQDGQKHVEILEIVECIESSPDPPSDDSQESSISGKQRNSKIPVRVAKKSSRTIRSPINKSTSSSTPLKYDKGPNSKTDQLIANILIDAFNEDNPENRDIHLVLSPRDKKVVAAKRPERSPNKKILNQQKSISGQPLAKYNTKFDAIPEEKGSQSVESSNEDLNNTEKAKTKSPTNKNVGRMKVEKHDVSTSPVPRFASIATSPIPPHLDNRMNDDDKKEFDSKLGTKEGWAGFCRPQTKYTPENEGSHPSSNNPSDREAVGTIMGLCSGEDSAQTTAPSSQRSLRTLDSRQNTNRTKASSGSDDKRRSKTNKSPKSVELNLGPNVKPRIKVPKHSSKKENAENIGKDANPVMVSKEQNKPANMKLPSPFRYQSFEQSSEMTTTSGSDSEAGTNCPVLVPRWPPITGPRHKRYYNRKPQRQEENFKMPYPNMSGGWSVTLAGSCYTTLPSDVEMKVCFPKNNPQQATSQSDSGLGEEKLYQKHGSNNICKRCANCENICSNCKTVQECKCKTMIKKHEDTKDLGGNQTFLPHQSRKTSVNSKSDNHGDNDRDGLSKKCFDYLPDVNSLNQSRSKKKATLKMARRFSLHCWLPEDRHTSKIKVEKMEISQTIAPIDGVGELSVFGCAIMPEIKPRVPTMSERDLTRVHTAQFYSRHRHL